MAGRQYGVLERGQLLERGVGPRAIKHRLASGRMHEVHRGVYALGRPELSLRGRWLAAVLSCGPQAVLSDTSAAALWGMIRVGRQPPSASGVEPPGSIHVTIPHANGRRRSDLILHRRASLLPDQVTARHGIPVTGPIATLVDLAGVMGRDRVEAAVNEADKLGLVDPERLRIRVEDFPRRPGRAALRRLLNRHAFTLTDSQLERALLPIAARAGLPVPETQAQVNGFRVDFLWRGLGLVVETDGLTYHRTPAQQARDRERDQAHAAAGLTCLRFTYAQVRFEPERVATILSRVARRLRG